MRQLLSLIGVLTTSSLWASNGPARSILPHSRPLTICEGSLVTQTMEKTQVIGLSRDFGIRPDTLKMDADLLVVSQSSVEDEFVILDRQTGSKLVDASILTDKANRLLQTGSRGYVVALPPENKRLVDNQQVVFSAFTSMNEHVVIVYNFKTGDTIPIFTMNGVRRSPPQVDVLHNKFIRVKKINVYENNIFFGFFDLSSGQELRVVVPPGSRLKISEDGTHLLMSQLMLMGPLQFSKNYLVQVDKRKVRDRGRTYAISDMGESRSFRGAIVASSGDLKRHIVDLRHLNVKPMKNSMISHLIPRLSLINLNVSRSPKPLSSWNDIQDWLVQAANRGYIVRRDGLIGELTPNAKTFALGLNFSVYGKAPIPVDALAQQSFEQNWLGLWSLTSRFENPRLLSSRLFDNNGERKPTGAVHSFKLLNDGRLIMAQATVKSQREGDVITVKIAEVKGVESIKMRIYRTEPFPPQPELPHRVSSLLIGESGQTVAIEIRLDGIRIIDLSQITPRDLE